MQKIPTLFARDERGRNARDEVTEGCEWVLDGEGVATRKWDGTACLIYNSLLYRRHRHKEEKGDPPPRWRHWSFDPEQRSGHGWLPVVDEPSSRYHREAFDHGVNSEGFPFVTPHTYELCGPKINKNPDGFETHVLVSHGPTHPLSLGERTFGAIRDYLEATEIEGIVFWHEDGRLAKVKRRDFGFPWPVRR